MIARKPIQFVLLLALALLVGVSTAIARGREEVSPAGADAAVAALDSPAHTHDVNTLDQHLETAHHFNADTARLVNGTNELRAPCPGGPVIDGITLDECVVRNITVGGNARTITVWYTNNPITATRMVDGNPVVLSHWVDNDTQPQTVAQWTEEAWQRFYADSTSAGESHEPYINGCGDNLNIQLEDGVGWAGIAYWASSGNCNIGIDSPTIRSGGGRRTVYHEVQHYLQYDYDNGCYASWQPNYPDNSEFVEGYADFGSNSVNSTVDGSYQVGSYNPAQSIYDEGYSNLFLFYLAERLGTLGVSTDANFHVDSMYNHYEECDDWDTLYVLDTLIPELSGGALTKEALVRNFLASLYAWPTGFVDGVAHPDLVYNDADDNSFSQPAFTQDVTISGGSQSWSDTTPDDWAARYYRVRPQTGCPYVQVDVDGNSGATLGISMFGKNNGASSLLWSAHTGEDFVRTFAGAGVHDEVVAIVNSFDNNYGYDVTFTCVNPALNILEPRQTNFALVGDPASPIAYLERFEVTSGGTAVRGLEASQFSFDAEGDAIAIVGEFLEVGDEYWTVLLPPAQPAGTTFVDHTVCLDGAICDTETNSLLYVDPGNSDIGLVFDASGSMDDEDVVGEGKRYILAQRAGKVEADLLRDGDRILVTDFSAENVPAGCGLPGGDGNCPLDLQTLLPRTDVVTPGTITAAKNAIDLVSPREWTPIGAALVDCKNQLTAAPFSLNPKYCFLLSDGEENVNPLYADVRDELVASGVVINTIGFGPEAPGALLAQIAADTGGVYRPVPTTPGTLARIQTDPDARLQAALDAGIDSRLAEQIAAPFLPGQLQLADVYDDYDTQAQGAARIFHSVQTNVPDGTWRESRAQVDASVQKVRFVVAGKQNDSLGCAGHHRDVEVQPPGDQRWIPISPATPQIPPPANWDIRNSIYDDVLVVTNPMPGEWGIRTRYRYVICAAGQPDPAQTAAATVGINADFMMNLSVQSTIHLEGRLLGLNENQGMAGDQVAIVASLLTRNGTLPGALVVGAVEKPGVSDFIVLRDDGNHGDGAAGDGIYGWLYSKTELGGSYGVRLVALLDDPADPGTILLREWNGGFWIDGPSRNDQDDDGMPDDWERRCKLTVGVNDAQLDLDQDGLINIAELSNGTLPCDPDTDNGGESDGSEVNGGRNPLWPEDDRVRPLEIVRLRPFNGGLVIGWSYGISYTNMIGYISTDPEVLGTRLNLGTSGLFTVTQLPNDQTHYVRLLGLNDTAYGPLSQAEAATPKADPDAPAGWMLINDGAPETASRNVMLHITASDTPLAGAAQSANAHQTDQLSIQYNEVSGGVQMRISNNPTLAGAPWQALAMEVPWTLSCFSGSQCQVYIQFRDAAGNESTIISDDIYWQPFLYLPFVIR